MKRAKEKNATRSKLYLIIDFGISASQLPVVPLDESGWE